MNKTSLTPLEKMKRQLKATAENKINIQYKVPALWTMVGEVPLDGRPSRNVNPGEYFLDHIEAIEEAAIKGINPLKSLNQQLPGGEGGSWIKTGSIFNMFVRLTTAYDHNSDGKLGGSIEDVTLNSDGFRESGTFLKSIAMLGYIKTLGCNVIHLLPVTAIGRDGNKGILGSPYAIKNPYRIEDSQADPILDMSVDEQFQAFIQACHLLGIRVVAEFVFRTASKDSEWVAQHPDWFYWIDERINDRCPGETDLQKAAASYGNPLFDNQRLDVIKSKVDKGDMSDLPAPDENYRNFFKLAPDAEDIRINEKGQYRALTKDPVSGEKVYVRIPGAFADWPPDDNQPPWGDVTYLKMYRDQNARNPEFNYIAYNTIRMYDNRLAQEELANQELWQAIVELIPHYQNNFGIDGVMVDMGHAVPVTLMQKLIARARSIDENFAFLSENFEIKQDSVDAGYNAVVGYAWWVEYSREGMYNLLNHIGNEGVPLPFFGAVENHNTPRASGREGSDKYARYAFLVNTMLPKSIPFIHSGQELGERMPVNTGLDFSDADLERLKDQPLALFDLCSYKWDGEHPMLGFISRVLQLRKEYSEVITDDSRESFCMVRTEHADVIAFIRRSQGKHLLVLFNRDMQNTLEGQLSLEWCLPVEVTSLNNLLSPHVKPDGCKVERQKLFYRLNAGDCCLFSW